MKHLFFALLLMVGLGAHAQAPTWTFSLPAGDINGLMDVATDDKGNAYVTGRFTHSMVLGNKTLTSAGAGPCLFIAKCSSGGNITLVAKLEGATDVLPYSIAVDQAGNCYVAGNFLGTLTYNRGQRISSRTVGSGSDVFLLRCEPSGTISWVRQADGSTSGIYGYNSAKSVAVDRSGNSYITGNIGGVDIRFENAHFGSGRNQGFVASYTKQGQLRWARVLADSPQSAGIASGGGGGVAVDDAGNCYLSGTSGRGWALDGITIPYSFNIYLARFDARRGNLLWAKSLPGQGDGRAIAVDEEGDVYVGGTFEGRAAFGTRPLTSAGGTDGFVARYDPDGTLDWATAVGGSQNDVVSALEVDHRGRQAVASGIANITPQSTNQASLTTLAPNGRVQQQVVVGGPGTSSGSGLALDDKGNIYTTGVFTGKCQYGPITLDTEFTKAYMARYGSRVPGSYQDPGTLPGTAGISLFPNPAHNRFTLRLTSKWPAGQALLYNHVGRVVAERPVAAGPSEVVFDTAALPEGLYVLRLLAHHQTAIYLVKVEH